MAIRFNEIVKYKDASVTFYFIEVKENDDDMHYFVIAKKDIPFTFHMRRSGDNWQVNEPFLPAWLYEMESHLSGLIQSQYLLHE